MTTMRALVCFVGCAMLVSCAGDSILGDGSQPSLAIAVVDGDAGITITEDTAGNTRFVGEIKNSGIGTGCFIGLSIDAFDANGDPVSGGQPFAFHDFLFGETFQFAQFFGFGAATFDHCLSAGATGSFDLRTTIPAGTVTSVATHPFCQGEESAGCLPQDGQTFFRPPEFVQLVGGTITETTDVTGHTMYTGTIINNRPESEVTSVARNVRIVFTAKNASGRVVDIVCMNLNGTTCSPGDFSNVTLGPQERWDFQVPLSIQPSQTCPGCFYYFINYTT